MHDFCSYVHSMNHTNAYLRNDRKIKFRMVSAQHFINETPGLMSQAALAPRRSSALLLHTVMARRSRWARAW